MWRVLDLAESGLLRQFEMYKLHFLVTPARDQGVENFAVVRTECARFVPRAIGTESWHVEDGPIKDR